MIERAHGMTWEEWKAELVRLAGDSYGPGGPNVECGEEFWFGYFDSGVSPNDALVEDLSYACDDN